MPKLKDLTGQKFGRLTVIERAKNSKCNLTRWKCKCECGNITIVQSGNLQRGSTKSCGCLYEEGKHRQTNTRLYKIWSHMKERCYKEKHRYFSRYGGRGISVCDEWKNSYTAFHDWAIANGYNDELTIDRINVNGNYCPENCRWATRKEQQNNRSCNVFITHNGKTQTIKQWAEELNINYKTLKTRLQTYHWEPEKAFAKESQK